MSADTSENLKTRKKSMTSVIFNDVANDTQICYHLVYPKSLNLVKRPKRTLSKNGETVASKRRRRGRPRKEEAKKVEEPRRSDDNGADVKVEESLKLPCSRTRSGRVSRPPKHMSKFVDIKAPASSNEINLALPDPPIINAIDVNVTNSTTEDVQPIQTNGTAPEAKKTRKNVARFTCGVCKKVYLGRKKMLKHHLAFPDHKTPTVENSQHTQTTNFEPFDSSEISMNGTHSFLFDELMKVVNQTAQTDRTHTFLTELSTFVCKVRSIKSRLIDTKATASTANECYLDKYICKVFDMREGYARINRNAFDTEAEARNEKLFNSLMNEQPVTNDLSSLSHLPSLEYNLNLFPQVNYDQITDNAVEAEALEKIHRKETIAEISPGSPILDIPLDLFSFNNIK